jgi:hypothetical protein
LLGLSGELVVVHLLAEFVDKPLGAVKVGADVRFKVGQGRIVWFHLRRQAGDALAVEFLDRIGREGE